MLLIDCPWCGPRDDAEFHYGGEAHIARPKTPDALSDAEWTAYLFLRENPKGTHLERWSHSHGCRRWFNAVRDTVSHEIVEVYAIGTLPKSEAGLRAYQDAWRRTTAAEANARAEDGA
jgi:sarcosine oxidase, subunit delta